LLFIHVKEARQILPLISGHNKWKLHEKLLNVMVTDNYSLVHLAVDLSLYDSIRTATL
jgi:hypothetical protein